jgi:Rieske Fe-S protein
MAEEQLNRRDFLSLCGAGCAFMTSGCIAKVYGGDGAFSVDDANFAALATVGGMAPINVEDRAVLLIRASEETVVALGRICTHMQCDLDPDVMGWYDVEQSRLQCRCHDAWYDLDGQVVGGPAPAALEKFVVDFDASSGNGRVIL